ncbi:MAG: elongation factor 1-beta [Candidatus Woesearchaeota archaeon]
MGIVLVTFKIMPESVDTDLDKVEEEAKKMTEKFGGKVSGFEKEPVAFGLNALVMKFSLDEAKGEMDSLEDNIRNIEGVINVEVTDMRRGFG